MENIKEKIINNKLFLITLLICVTLTSSIMLLIYKHNTSSVSIKIDPITDSTIDEEFTPYLQKFYDINLSLKDCVNGLTIDTKNTISILNSNINELSELQNKRHHRSTKSLLHPWLHRGLASIPLCPFTTEISSSPAVGVGGHSNSCVTLGKSLASLYISIMEN